jgi:DNA-binding response OmpR family regulator
MTEHRIYTTAVADVYPHYVSKVEKKVSLSLRAFELHQHLMKDSRFVLIQSKIVDQTYSSSNLGDFRIF